jgi:hypothetical protein
MRHWRDKWLVQRVLSGDKAAGEQFVIEHYEAIFRFLRNLTGSKEDAEDLTQANLPSGVGSTTKFSRRFITLHLASLHRLP